MEAGGESMSSYRRATMVIFTLEGECPCFSSHYIKQFAKTKSVTKTMTSAKAFRHFMRKKFAVWTTMIRWTPVSSRSEQSIFRNYTKCIIHIVMIMTRL